MSNQYIDKLLAKEMTRKEFTLFLGMCFASLFGITAVIREIALHAATPAATTEEAEKGVTSGNAAIVNDSSASGGEAIKFGSATTSGTNLPQPNWTTTTIMSNLSTTASDNTAALQAYLTAASVNTKLVFPNSGPAQYRFSQNIDINVGNVGIFGGTANAADTVLLSTDQADHGYRVYANNHFAKGFTHLVQRAASTVRSSQNEQGASTLLIETAVDGFKGEDLVLDSAAAAGFFAYGATNYSLNRCVSQNSLADSFHNTRGCIGGQFTDCTAKNGGDDGFAVVQYGDDPSNYVSSNITFTRCQSYSSAARGFSAICVHDISYVDCYAESSYAPGVYIGREGGNTEPQPCYNITSTGTFILNNCCTGTDQGSNGAFFLLNEDNTATVHNVTVANCAIINTPTSNNACVRALIYSSGVIDATLNNFSFYGTTPTTSGSPWVYQNVAGNQSSITLNNWAGLAALPNDNWTATIQPSSAAPTPA